jgi:hypothetical protein
MGTILLWIVLGAIGIVCIIGTLKWLDRLLLRAEEKGWIFYRKKSGSGTVSGGNHPFLELGRAHLRCPSGGLSVWLFSILARADRITRRQREPGAVRRGQRIGVDRCCRHAGRRLDANSILLVTQLC